jgi:Xaa-Pro aminopeptidase
MSPDLPPLEVVDRLDRLRVAAADHADAIVISDLSSIRWCTGFTGSNALLVVTNDDSTLITDGRYRMQAPEELSAARSNTMVEIAIQPIEAATEALGSVEMVALEADVLTWSEQQSWMKATDIELVPTQGLVRELRAVKDDAELARIERAATIADAALAELEGLLVIGTTEREMAHELERSMRAAGATGPAYETIVAGGPNAALPHARPTERQFEDGDLVVIDVGSVVEGYRSDMTRTFTIGSAGDEPCRIRHIVTEAQAAGVAAVRPGIEAREIDHVCRSVITDAGYGDAFSHGTGHGVGLDIHELPAVHARSTAILQPGHVITVEPGIYIPALGGCRVEDLLVVTESGCRSLTNSPKPSC